MFTTKRIFIGLGVVILAVAAPIFISPLTTASCAPGAAADCRERASGHGTITFSNGVKRQFSFSAQRMDDGTARGNAVIHNPNFDPRFRGHIEVTCMDVVGNRARIAGVAKNTNDPNLENNTAVFEVFDNGEPGKADTISGVYFSPPNSPPPSPAYCQAFENLQQNPIDGGNIQVEDCP